MRHEKRVRRGRIARLASGPRLATSSATQSPTTGLKRDLEQWLRYYDFDRVHTGRLTRGRIPAEIVYGARKVRAKMSLRVGTSR